MAINTSKINEETFKFALTMRQIRKELLILHVDDQKFSRDLLKSVLGGNHKIIFADSGEEALASYVQNAPDILFLDLELPRIGGHKVLELIIKLDPQAFIVVVSANNYPEEISKAMQEGARGFIAKPFNKQKIMQIIDLFSSTRKK